MYRTSLDRVHEMNLELRCWGVCAEHQEKRTFQRRGITTWADLLKGENEYLYIHQGSLIPRSINLIAHLHIGVVCEDLISQKFMLKSVSRIYLPFILWISITLGETSHLFGTNLRLNWFNLKISQSESSADYFSVGSWLER
jgi:hypothetical protein